MSESEEGDKASKKYKSHQKDLKFAARKWQEQEQLHTKALSPEPEDDFGEVSGRQQLEAGDEIAGSEVEVLDHLGIK
jgi:hypothetical protein